MTDAVQNTPPADPSADALTEGTDPAIRRFA